MILPFLSSTKSKAFVKNVSCRIELQSYQINFLQITNGSLIYPHKFLIPTLNKKLMNIGQIIEKSTILDNVMA